MSHGRDRRAEEARQREELAEHLAAACREMVDARAKVVTNAMVFEWLQEEQNQLVRTMEAPR
jgi:hypothetical protein